MTRKASIGTRWTPSHVIKRDSVAGTYEEVNAPLESSTEARMQTVLLAAKTDRYPVLWWAAIVVVCLVSAVAIAVRGATP